MNGRATFAPCTAEQFEKQMAASILEKQELVEDLQLHSGKKLFLVLKGCFFAMLLTIYLKL